MPHSTRIVLSTLAAILAGTVTSFSAGQEAVDGRELPPALAPFEYLIGRWKGQAVPRDNPSQQFRGWTETHAWAWRFAAGKPVALSFTMEGGKLLEKGTLTFDPKARRYRLEGKSTGARGEPLVFEGILDSSGKLLTLESAGKGGRARLTLRANSNYVRYTTTLDRKEDGATLFKPAIEVGLTREGESFAAGASTAERPRCIITGGAAAMTVSYQGQSYPICCTGCRDEFVENPKKYLKLLSLKAGSSKAGAKPGPSKGSSVSRFEDAFASDVDPARSKPVTKMTQGRVSGPAEKGETTAGEREAASASVDAKRGATTKAKPKSKPITPDPLAARGATLLRLGQNLEKSGKSEAALKQYRQILKEYPNTPASRTAADRIKVLEAR